MNTTTAAKILGVNLPLTEHALKTAYRRWAMFKHPDRGGSEEAMVELTDAYNVLKSTELVFAEEGLDKEERTTSGERLVDLGKGYPITTAAVLCDTCSGKGYREETSTWGWDWVTCPTEGCEGGQVTGRREKCVRCGGSKKFSRHGRVVKKDKKCDNCMGVGSIWIPEHPYRCKKCNPETGPFVPFGISKRPGYVREKRSKLVKYFVCSSCKGIGEVEMFNPVLKRGLLTCS